MLGVLRFSKKTNEITVFPFVFNFQAPQCLLAVYKSISLFVFPVAIKLKVRRESLAQAPALKVVAQTLDF